MLTKDQLIEAGYKPFKQSGIKEFTSSFFQKRFDDSCGKKYFITIAEYDNKDYFYADLPDFSYTAEAQFETSGKTFDVSLHNSNSVEDMEKFFEQIWVTMGCEYDEEF